MADTAQLPPVTDSCWRDIVTGKLVKPWNHLALELMLTRFSMAIKSDPSSENIERCAREVHAFFEHNRLASPHEAIVLSAETGEDIFTPPHKMGTVAEVAAMIRQGRSLLLAGNEELLSSLPLGNWIGGTSSVFMTDEGGMEDRGRIFYTDLTNMATEVVVKNYTASELRDIADDYPKDGFTVLIVPGLSEIHGSFAREVQDYMGVFNRPLVGWVSGVPVSEIGKITPKVFAGSMVAQGNIAAAMHISLPSGYHAVPQTISLFEQGTGPVIEFTEDGFSSRGLCLIDGKPAVLADYIEENKVDMRWPLVADYNGAKVNVSLRMVDGKKGITRFYAPVFRSVHYRLAKPLGDYTQNFNQALASKHLGAVAFSCNCILNYLYADMAGKKTKNMVGPITFGEIAYILLNQTLVYISVMKNEG